MSQTMNVQIEMRDLELLKRICGRLKLKYSEGTHKLYRDSHTGLGIKLPGWNYPVVIKEDGTAVYDNYNPNGRNGSMQELYNLQNYYGVEKARTVASRYGHSCTQQTLANGDIQLTISIAA